MNSRKGIVILILASLVLCWSCEMFSYGKLGGADQTSYYFPGEDVFEERLSFLSGVWYSHYAGIGRLDGYRIRRWSNVTSEDKAKMQGLFPGIDVDNPLTYSLPQTVPQNSDYILLHDGSVYGQQDDNSGGSGTIEGSGYMGLVRAINIFNGDKNRGSIIIEYFEEADPPWLSGSQGLARGEKPFFGVYYRVLSPDVVQMANAVDLVALYNGDPYYTEKGDLQEAIDSNSVENEAEYISWGVVIPHDRE